MVAPTDNTNIYIGVGVCCCLLICSALAFLVYYYLLPVGNATPVVTTPPGPDPCACRDTADYGGTCGDPDSPPSGFNWCYVRDPAGCLQRASVPLTKSGNSEQYWKRC